jgi:hypothetical protein
VSGNQPIGGKFLYVVDNVKTEADPNPLSIMIGSGATVAATTSPATTTPSSTPPAADANNPASANPSAANPATTATTTLANTTSSGLTPTHQGDEGGLTPSGTSPSNTVSSVTSTSSPATGTTTSAPDLNTTPANTSSSVATTPSGSTPVSSTPTNTSTAGAVQQNTAAVSAAPNPPLDGVSASRSLSTGSVAQDGSVTVSVTIHKGALSGFAKLEEIIPTGFTATEGEKKTASFTFVDNKMKMVWLSLPSDSVFTITYQLVAGASASGNQSVTGKFSFVANGGAEHYEINATTFSVAGGNAIAGGGTGSQAGSGSQTGNGSQTAGGGTNGTSGSQKGGNGSENDMSGSGNGTNGSTTTSQIHNAGSPGVNYFVQIMALHTLRSVAFVKGLFRITETIDLRDEEGLHKYVAAKKFSDYKGAHDHRDDIKRNNGVSDAFVVAYNTGKRITVQEALMITHQQWYQ